MAGELASLGIIPDNLTEVDGLLRANIKDANGSIFRRSWKDGTSLLVNADANNTITKVLLRNAKVENGPRFDYFAAYGTEGVTLTDNSGHYITVLKNSDKYDFESNLPNNADPQLILDSVIVEVLEILGWFPEVELMLPQAMLGLLTDEKNHDDIVPNEIY